MLILYHPFGGQSIYTFSVHLFIYYSTKFVQITMISITSYLSFLGGFAIFNIIMYNNIVAYIFMLCHMHMNYAVGNLLFITLSG